MAEMQKTKQKHGGSGGDDDAVTITVRTIGGEEQVFRVKKGTRLIDFLREHGFETSGYGFLLNGRELRLNDKGELVDNPSLDENAILDIELERLSGGY